MSAKYLLYTGKQLLDTVSWVNYNKLNSDSQAMLQWHFLAFLYNQVFWRYKIIKNSNDSKDSVLLIPHLNYMVAAKHLGDDFKWESLVSATP